MEYYFTAEKLAVGYDNRPLIENIDFSLKRGEILTLIGPNGAGKSTILKSIARQLLQCYKQRKRYHYCIIGLPFILFQIPFYQKNHYTCSSFVTNILEQNGISLFQKHFSLVTPRDFYELEQTETIFEGSLHDFNRKVYLMIGAAYES